MIPHPRRYLTPLSWLVLALVLLGGCTDAQPAVDPQSFISPPLKTTVIGLVVDDNGRGVAGATVTLHGQRVTSDSDGVFAFTDATVPSDRALVQAKAPGYFTASRGFIPTQQGASMVQLTLANRPLAGIVSAASGGAVNVGNGATVVLPAGGIVRADGAPYSGPVHVMARAWQPDDADFSNCFPGDARALAADGEMVLLVSLGFQNIELEDASGNELKLAKGAKAVLGYTIPNSMQSVAPDRIPMWYFDETKELWIEEGEATRQGDTYVGQVSHFTPWNCDWPGLYGRICGRVKVCGEDPAGGITVRAGAMETTTDAEGKFCMDVATNWPDPYDVYATTVSGLTSDHLAVSALMQGNTTNVELSMRSAATVVGTLVGCDDIPLRSGIVRIWWDGSLRSVSYVENGSFAVTIPANTQAIIKGAGAVDTVPPQPACATYNAGKVSFCSDSNDDDTARQIITWTESSSTGQRSFVSGWGAQAPDTTVGGAVLTGEVLTLFANAPGANGKINQLRLRARAITTTRTYNVRSYRTDLGMGVYVVDDSLRYATSNDSSMVGFDAMLPPGTLTISRLTSHSVGGSFMFKLYRGSDVAYTLTGTFTGPREP